jgi:regulator of RNase E activity RraA
MLSVAQAGDVIVVDMRATETSIWGRLMRAIADEGCGRR